MSSATRWVHVACFLVAGLAGCRRTTIERAPAPPDGEVWLSEHEVQAARVKVEPVQLRELDGRVVTSGRVAFDDMHVAHVLSPVSGRVSKVHAGLGERVKKGAPLITVVSPDVGAFSSDLDKAHADLIAARSELQRQRELYDAHAGPKRDLDTAVDSAAKAKAELERARQKARLFEAGSFDKVTQTFTLRSPLDGEVITRNVNVGMEIGGQYSGGGAAELFTVGEIDPIWVLSDLYEMDVAKVQRGAKAHVSVVAYPHREFDGTIDWIADALDPATRTARVRTVLANPGRELKPEMFATVTIEIAGEKKLAVKRDSVLRLGEQSVVFVQLGLTPAHQVRFERRPVDVDDDDIGEYVPVNRGVKEGDLVVSSQAILLSGMVRQ